MTNHPTIKKGGGSYGDAGTRTPTTAQGEQPPKLVGQRDQVNIHPYQWYLTPSPAPSRPQALARNEEDNEAGKTTELKFKALDGQTLIVTETASGAAHIELNGAHLRGTSFTMAVRPVPGKDMQTSIGLEDLLRVRNGIRREKHRLMGADYEEYEYGRGKNEVIIRFYNDKDDVPTGIAFLFGELAKKEVNAAVTALFD